MKTYRFGISAAGALGFALAFSGGAAYAGSVSDACKTVSAQIADYAASGGLDRIGVLEFVAADGAAREVAAFASKEIERNLANSKKNALDDRVRLEDVLEGAKSAGGGGAAKALRELFSAEAVVTGIVFGSGTELRVIAKLNEVRTGKVLLIAESVLSRQQRAARPLTGVKLPGFADSYPWQETAAARPTDLRSAVSDSALSSCAARKARVAELNAKLVDGKARYWAGKMSEPYFGASDPGSNPGSEIGDREVREKFYELLAGYIAEGTKPDTPPEIAELLDLETRYLTECGFR